LVENCAIVQQRRLRFRALRPEYLDLLLGRGEDCLIVFQCRGLLPQISLCLLSSLDRSGAGFRELLIAGVLLFRKSEIGLGRSDICVCLIYRGLLLRNLRVETADIGFSRRHVRLCLVDRRLIVARIDPQRHLARLDPLVIGHQQLGDVAGDLWDNRDVVRLSISVVGRLEPSPNGVPVPAETDRTNEQKSANDRGNDQPPAPPPCPRFRRLGLQLALVGRAGR